MKKIMILTTAMLMLTAMSLTSGCATAKKTTAMQQHPDEYYRKVPAAEHVKRFPHGHEHKPGSGDPNLRCFFAPDSPNYFCQFFDDTDE